MGLQVKFWGTRGIISSPSQDNKTYGGNTSCMQILGTSHIILIDTGFGCSLLGEQLMDLILKEKKALTIHIFYTHFHWDHIQGLPFFHPIYFPTTEIHIYAPAPQSYIESSLDVLFDGSYSPFEGLRSMPSKIIFHEIQQPIDLDRINVDYCRVDHGHYGRKAESSTYAYKFRLGNETVTMATDHSAEPGETNDHFVQFAHGTDLLIHDGQLFHNTTKHSSDDHATTEQAILNAKRIGAKSLIITHHDPEHNDTMIDQEAEILKKNHPDIDFSFAREGMIYPVKP
jgi:phosphoribosyl 1,2-cyclic phosphodiesterase